MTGRVDRVAGVAPAALPALLTLALRLAGGQQAWVQAEAQASAAASAKAGKEPDAVEIKGLRNPELKSYRVMAAGLDAFDEYHALAPAASEVRFKLRPRSRRAAHQPEALRRRPGLRPTAVRQNLS